MIKRIIAVLLSFVVIASVSMIASPCVSAKAYADIKYGSKSENQTLDLALPKKKGTAGLLLMLHGGSWLSGDKSYYSKYLEKCASKYGIACASMNYRFITEVDMFDMLNDITAAMKKIKKYAAKKGVKINRVMLLGYSAGAHLAMLYSYTRAGKSPLKIVAVASFSGPTDFTDKNFIPKNKYAKYFEMTELASLATGKIVTKKSLKKAAKSISPAFQVKRGSVPTLVCHGKKDKTVPYSNAKTLVAALKKKKVTYKFFPFDYSGHNLSSEKDEDTSLKADRATKKFIKKYLVKS